MCIRDRYNAYKYRNALTTVLGIVQLVGSLAFAVTTLPAAEAVTATPLYLDYMSVIMVLAVGIVGSLICVYALGYMKDFQAHDEHEAAARADRARPSPAVPGAYVPVPLGHVRHRDERQP